MIPGVASGISPATSRGRRLGCRLFDAWRVRASANAAAVVLRSAGRCAAAVRTTVVRVGAAGAQRAGGGDDAREVVGRDDLLHRRGVAEDTPEEVGGGGVVGVCGDGVGFGGEGGDAGGAVLVGADRVVRGRFGGGVGRDRGQDLAGGVLIELADQIVPVSGPGAGGLVEGEVGVVGVPAAGHRDVERLPGGSTVGQHVGGVHGEALGAVRGDRVAELDVFSHIRRREGDRDRVRGVGVVEQPHGEGAVAVDAVDEPALPVPHEPLPPLLAVRRWCRRAGCGRCGGSPPDPRAPRGARPAAPACADRRPCRR